MKKRKNTVGVYKGGMLLGALLISMVAGFSYSAKRSLFNVKQQENITPDEVLKALIAGNKRFYSYSPAQRQSLVKLSKKASKRGQFPKAVILACMDSRSIPELIFDQSIADMFTLRVAGNIVNREMLASMEYATKYAGSKLIVIMGHTQCGAIQAACNGGAEGNLESLVDAIEPAVAVVQEQNPDEQLDCSDNETLTAIALQNVRTMKARIMQESPVIREMVSNGDIALVGALHNLRSGVVHFE